MTKTKVAVFSLRWWLEDRKTGKLVGAQRPNLLLALAIAGLLLTRLLPSSLLAVVLAKTLWLAWSGDELLRGVNPWRRALGLTVAVFTLLV